MNAKEQILDLYKSLRMGEQEDSYVRDKKIISQSKNPFELFFRTDKYEMSLRLEYRQKVIEELLEKLVKESEKVEEVNKKVYDKIVNELNMATTDKEPIKTELSCDYIPSNNVMVMSRRIYVQGFEMVYFIDTNFEKIVEDNIKENR